VAALLSASVLVGALAALGWVKITPSSILQGGAMSASAAVLISLVTYAGIGVFEEALRVYQIRNLTEGLAATKVRVGGAMAVAVLFSALSSVIMHMASGNPPFLAYVLVSGAFYGLFFLWTRRSALAIAFHFSWDFAVSTLFLLEVNANTDDAAFFLVLLDGGPGLGGGRSASPVGDSGQGRGAAGRGAVGSPAGRAGSGARGLGSAVAQIARPVC